MWVKVLHLRVKDGSSNERERKGSLREREEERMVKWRGKVARVTCQFKVHLEGQEGEAVSRLYVMHSPHEIPLHSQASCIVCKITKPSPKFTLHIFSLSLSLLLSPVSFWSMLIMSWKCWTLVYKSLHNASHWPLSLKCCLWDTYLARKVCSSDGRCVSERKLVSWPTTKAKSKVVWRRGVGVVSENSNWGVANIPSRTIRLLDMTGRGLTFLLSTISTEISDLRYPRTWRKTHHGVTYACVSLSPSLTHQMRVKRI